MSIKRKAIQEIFKEAAERNGRALEQLAYVESLEIKARLYDELNDYWNYINENEYQKLLFIEKCNEVFNRNGDHNE